MLSATQSGAKWVNFENDRTRWCNYHNSKSHSDDECHRQKRDSKRKESSTADNNGQKCYKLSCCNSRFDKKSKESGDKSYTPPRIGLSFVACHLPLSQQADCFQLLVDSGLSKRFIGPELIREVETKMQKTLTINPTMEIKTARNNILCGTAQDILIVLVRGTDDILKEI